LVFARYSYVRSQLLTMNADGSNETPITPKKGFCIEPDWSPA
jgi:Tol biopolymer transport system component